MQYCSPIQMRILGEIRGRQMSSQRLRFVVALKNVRIEQSIPAHLDTPKAASGIVHVQCFSQASMALDEHRCCLWHSGPQSPMSTSRHQAPPSVCIFTVVMGVTCELSGSTAPARSGRAVTLPQDRKHTLVALDYADDTTLFFKTPNQLQEALSRQ